MLFPVAWADAAGAAQPSMFEQMLPLIFTMGILFLYITYQSRKRQKTQTDFLSGLQRGSSVVTSSGILGTIEGITEQYITLEIAAGVRIRILKNQIVGPAQLQEVKK